MRATLYNPQLDPAQVDSNGLSLPDKATGLANIPEQVAVMLDCSPDLVDVLACGPHYVAYSIFDSEQNINLSAMQALTELTGTVFETDDEDHVLRGPVLVVQA